MLLGVGQNKIKTIKVYRELTGSGLYEAKRDVENAPIKVIGGLSESEAHDVSAALRQLGNTTSVEVDNESIIPNSTLQNYDIFEAVKSDVKDRVGINTSYVDIYNYSETENLTTDYSDPWDKPKKSKKDEKKAKKLQMAQEKAATKAAIKSAKKTIAEAKASSFEAKSKKSSTRQGVLILFISALVYGVIFILSFLGAKGSNNKKAEPPVIVQPTMTSYMDGKYLSKEDIMNEIGSSIVFNYFANDAFGKNITELTDAELKSVIYIDYNTDSDYRRPFLQYKLKDGLERRLSVPRESLKFEYFSIFPNLEYLDSEYITETRTYIVEFDKLTHIGYESDVWDSIDKDLDPKKITSMHLYDDFYRPDVTKFVNLTEIEIENDFHSFDFSVLQQLPKLRSLKINSGMSANVDVSGIVALKSLEELYLNCEGLKDVRFIEKLPNLKVLSIENTNVISIESVAKIGSQLDELYLIDNYSVDDYSFIGELTNLKKLGFVDNFDQDNTGFPDISRLKDLDELIIGKPHDLSALHNLSNLEKLTLESPYDHDFSFLLDMPELKELHVHHGSLYSSEIYTIAECTNIEELCLYYTFVWDDISCVLNMPKVRSLHLDNASFGIMTNKVNTNNSLEYISMYWGKVYSLNSEGQFYNNNSIIDLSEVSDVFEKLQALREINVHGHMLQDADCFADNKNLCYLDISGTYIVDLSPLKNLSLNCIICESTQIYDYAGFDEQNIIKN